MYMRSLFVGLALAIAPVAATASTVSIKFLDAADTELLMVTDGGVGDIAAEAGVVGFAGAVGGMSFTMVSATQFLAPPTDQLQTVFSVTNTSQTANTLKLLSTAHFSNSGSGNWLGTFTATANDATGDIFSVMQYIGGSAFDTSTAPVLSATGAVFSASAMALFDPTNYWITQSFDITLAAGSSASASADFVGVIPVPAAGLLLIGGLGGLALIRRRKTA